MKYTLTGGNGFIGSLLTRRLLLEGHEVALITRRGSSNEHLLKVLNEACGDFKLYDYDGSADSLRPALKDADRVIHLATLFDRKNDAEATSELIVANIIFPSQLMAVMVDEAPAGVFVTTSSWSAFDGENNYNPANVYSATKDAFERMGYAFPLKKAFVRMSDTYGAGDWRPKLHNFIVNAVKNGDAFEFGSPAEQTINFSHADDVMDGLLATCDFLEANAAASETHVYDFYYPENIISLGELADIIKKAKPDAQLSLPAKTEAKKLPTQREKIPGFVIKKPVRDHLAETLLSW